MAAQPAHRRPFGVKVITALLIATILLGLLSIIIYWYSPELQENLRAEYGPGVAALFLLAAATVLGLDLVILIGFIRLERWAWYLVILLTGFSLATSLWRYVLGYPDYLSMVVSVLIVLYLNQREVQQAFVRPGIREVQG